MDALAIILSFFAALIVFDVAAVTGGVDSRDPLPDDHRR